MEFRYQIPEHLEGFIGGIPEPQLNAIMTMLFEYAIQHRMIDYPRSEVENSIDEIRRLCNDIKSKQSLESSLVFQMLANINAQIATLHTMASGGQMPPVAMSAPVAFPQYMPMMYQQAPMQQEQAPAQEEQMQSSVIRISDEELNDREVDKGELGTGDDETMSAFEDELFK